MCRKVKGGKIAPWMSNDDFREFEQDFYKNDEIRRQKKGEGKC